MKFSALALATLFMIIPVTHLHAEKKEAVSFLSKVQSLGASIGFGGLSIGQFASAGLIGYFVGANVVQMLQAEEPEKAMCAIASGLAVVSVPTLLYAAWKTGTRSVQSFNKAFPRKQPLINPIIPVPVTPNIGVPSPTTPATIVPVGIVPSGIVPVGSFASQETTQSNAYRTKPS